MESAMPLSPEAAWRSPDLGPRRAIPTPAGDLMLHERGAGRTLVLVHGWLTNANLWRKVVPRLAGAFRVVTLDLPLGSHVAPMAADADLSPAGVGRLIGAATAALGVEDAVIVGNDSGGVYSQIALSQGAPAAGLVINASETPGATWPPAAFDPLQAAARAGLLRLGLMPLRDAGLRMADTAFGLLAGKPLEVAAGDSYVLPALEDDAILADAEKAIAAGTTADMEAATAWMVANFRRPVALIWPAEDQVFPHAAAHAYAAALPDGRYEEVAGSRSFTPEDAPEALADRIAAFAGEV
jgi:pimeloyl-ACP methyl ester carboxylesterase